MGLDREKRDIRSTVLAVRKSLAFRFISMQKTRMQPCSAGIYRHCKVAFESSMVGQGDLSSVRRIIFNMAQKKPRKCKTSMSYMQKTIRMKI